MYHKIKELATGLNNLRESVTLIEKDRDESWEAVSHSVSTMVESSVGSLTERLTELEHTVQSQGTTPVTDDDDDDVLDMKTWSTLEQVIWAELNKVKETAQEVPNIYTLCEGLQENQVSREADYGVVELCPTGGEVSCSIEVGSRCSKGIYGYPEEKGRVQ